VETEFFDIAFGQEGKPKLPMDKAPHVVRQALEDAAKSKLHSFPHPWISWMSYSGRIVPWQLLLKAMERWNPVAMR
jgi:hypothetical protein